MYAYTYFKNNYIEFESRYLWKIEERKISDEGFISGIRLNVSPYVDYKVEGANILLLPKNKSERPTVLQFYNEREAKRTSAFFEINVVRLPKQGKIYNDKEGNRIRVLADAKYQPNGNHVVIYEEINTARRACVNISAWWEIIKKEEGER